MNSTDGNEIGLKNSNKSFDSLENADHDLGDVIGPGLGK